MIKNIFSTFFSLDYSLLENSLYYQIKLAQYVIKS